jgi:WD40 repeat protein
LGSLTDVGDAVLWDVATGKEIGSPLGEAPQGSINGFAFSPNGQILASGANNGDLVLWDAATGKEIGTAFNIGSANAIFSVAFSPDGRTLAIGTDTGEVLFWDLASRSLLGPPLTGLAGQVNSVVFSPRGDLLAVGDGGNTFSTGPARGNVVLVPSLYWDSNFETASAVLCPEVRGNLTRAQWAEYVPDEPYQTICPG